MHRMGGEEMVTRRSVLKAAALAGAAFSVGGRAVAQLNRRSCFNVLMICLDDMNDWCGFLGGHPQAITPYIDALAATGTAFQRAYCVVPLCNPSRVATLTSLDPRITNLWTNAEADVQAGQNFPNVIQHFRAQGYYTFGAGKVFHNGAAAPNTWDETINSTPPSPLPAQIPTIGACIGIDCGTDVAELDVADSKMSDYKRATNFAAKLSTLLPEPFFAAYGTTKPHQPWYVPRKYFDRFPIDQIQLPWHKPNDL